MQRSIRALLDRSGVSAVEFALMLPILVSMFVLTVDYGMEIYAKMQVSNAAEAGADWALLHGWSSAGVSGAVTQATSLTVTATPAPTSSCGCPSGTTITAATCGSTCSNGTTAGTYVTVHAQAAYSPLIRFPLARSATLTAQSILRIQ